MTYLFGWRESDISSETGTSNMNVDQQRAFSPAGGFIVAEDCTVNSVFFRTTQSDRVARVYIYNAVTNSLIAASGETDTVVGDTEFLFPGVFLAESTPVFLSPHSPTLLNFVRESTNFRFFPNATRAYVDGPIDPWETTNSSNLGRPMIWAEGVLGAVEPEPSIEADESITLGTTFEFSINDFDSPPDAAKLIGSASNELVLTNIELVSGNIYRADIPGLGNNVNRVLLGAVTLEASNSLESATTETQLLPPESHPHILTLPADPDTSENSLVHNWSPTGGYLGSQILLPFPAASVTEWEAPEAGVYTLYGIDASDGVMQSFVLTAGDVEPGPGPQPSIFGISVKTLRGKTL